MSAATTPERPSGDDLEALLAKYGTRDNVAAALGVPRRTVRRWFSGHLAATRDARVAETAAAIEEEYDDAGPTREELLEAELRELKARSKKTRKEQIADERLLLAFERAIEQIPTNPISAPLRGPKKGTPTGAHHRAFLMLSDFHGGEVVDTEVINGLNRYDWDIMLERVDELVESVWSHLKRMPALTGIDVGFIGDMCSGANHDEIKETNQFGMADQACKMALLQADILGRLAGMVPDIRVVAVEGNHPRLEKKPVAKNPHNNMDYVANMFTKAMVEAKGIPVSQFEIGKGSAIWQIAGRNMYVFHGDGIMSTMPGVPWGGVMRRVNTLQAQYPIPLHHFVLGHFHQSNVVQGGRILMNGSLKGVDEFSLKRFGGGDPPTQLLLTFDERASRMTDVRYVTPRAGL